MTHQLYYSDKHPTAFYPYSTLAPPNYHHHRLPLQHLTPLLPVVDDNTYHYSLPQRKIRISNSRPKLSRSLSTGSLRHLEEQQQHFINQGITEYPENVYNWYYQQQNEPQYIHSQRSTIKPKNRKRSKGREHNERNTLERNEDSDDRYDNNNSEYNIDPDVYTDIDGEPMNELELLAAKNAIRNETIFYDENDDKERTAKQVSSSSDRKTKAYRMQ
ncbi:hypothetical protein BDF20DRAFT_411180 [Mycotypha africana]|uniref:uncharacterized protein n=1 Tax=Mycotypha africana TaxID=64632 RepID=UPI00230053F0|nr:uncharacterized protein BDF20DRAFT_411180 [Mycotypha africana]KAI8981599.1 hypothetical protein BDF20DRAFT_411180 [Mycotypha africana]